EDRLGGLDKRTTFEPHQFCAASIDDGDRLQLHRCEEGVDDQQVVFDMVVTVVTADQSGLVEGRHRQRSRRLKGNRLPRPGPDGDSACHAEQPADQSRAAHGTPRVGSSEQPNGCYESSEHGVLNGWPRRLKEPTVGGWRSYVYPEATPRRIDQGQSA